MLWISHFPVVTRYQREIAWKREKFIWTLRSSPWQAGSIALVPKVRHRTSQQEACGGSELWKARYTGDLEQNTLSRHILSNCSLQLHPDTGLWHGSTNRLRGTNTVCASWAHYFSAAPGTRTKPPACELVGDAGYPNHDNLFLSFFQVALITVMCPLFTLHSLRVGILLMHLCVHSL